MSQRVVLVAAVAERPPGTPIDTLILHYTGMQGAAAALDRLCDPVARVSSHYVVEEDGRREEGEVEVRNPSPHTASPFVVADDVAEATRVEGRAVEEMRVTRAETPPVHARVVVDNYNELQEHNPWA